MFESLLREWDGEEVIIRHDRPTGAFVFIAIHSTRLGPAAGGTRMKSYPDLAAALVDALRLAEGMTYKFALPGIATGGAKAVVAVPEVLDDNDRSALLRRYGTLVQQLGGLFSTGPDVGTSATDMDIIAETGAPYVFGRTPTGGGAGSTGPATALGVFTGIQIASQHRFGGPSLEGLSVLVQGTGSVGGALIEHLRSAGAAVLFSEVDEAAIRHYRDEMGLRFIPIEQVYGAECDIFAPCALGGVLNETSIPLLKCQVISGGANNQLATVEDAQRLHDRDILYAPDYVVNVGGAIFAVAREARHRSEEEALREVVDKVEHGLRQVLELATCEDITTEAAARYIARQRMSAAPESESQ